MKNKFSRKRKESYAKQKKNKSRRRGMTLWATGNRVNRNTFNNC